MHCHLYSTRERLLRATMLAGLGVIGTAGLAWAGTPFGVYIVVDPSNSNDTTYLGASTAISPLFGTLSCSGMPTTCTGGVTGIFISVPWNDFQQWQSSMGTKTVILDPKMHLQSVMNSISSIENPSGPTAGPTFNLTLGLKAGDNAAYDVLDLYAAVGGSPSGTAPSYYTTLTITKDEMEMGSGCAFSYTPSNSTTVSSNGGTFGTSGFPEQCVMRTDGAKLACIQQPRIWGSDTASTEANSYYVTAYTAAVQDLANYVTGKSGYGGPYAHHIQALKVTGISSHDEEIAIPGEPHLAQPPGGFYCGYPSASDNEGIWTEQTGSDGQPIYQTSVMESTWLSLVSASIGITSSLGDSLGYIIDVVGTNQFPPVGPAGCGGSITCTYTPGDSSQLPGLLTGEMEHLIVLAFGDSLLSTGNVSVQNQGLESGTPSYSGESNYGTVQIPCAMNAVSGINTAIGYQSGGATFSSGSDKLAYLESITNGASYGAQYLELFPFDLANFISDTGTVTFNGISGYGTTASQNINMLSTTISAALTTMAANAANSASGTLCHLPVSGEWSYPYPG